MASVVPAKARKGLWWVLLAILALFCVGAFFAGDRGVLGGMGFGALYFPPVALLVAILDVVRDIRERLTAPSQEDGGSKSKRIISMG
jgi:hypothetical protein